VDERGCQSGNRPVPTLRPPSRTARAHGRSAWVVATRPTASTPPRACNYRGGPWLGLPIAAVDDTRDIPKLGEHPSPTASPDPSWLPLLAKRPLDTDARNRFPNFRPRGRRGQLSAKRLADRHHDSWSHPQRSTKRRNLPSPVRSDLPLPLSFIRAQDSGCSRRLSGPFDAVGEDRSPRHPVS